MTKMNKLNYLLSLIAVTSLMACSGSESDSSKEETMKTAPEVKVELAQEETVKAAPEVKVELTEEEALLKRGKTVWIKCRTCHETEEGARHKVGPNLFGIMGAEAATREGFTYSKALESSGIVWDDEAMDAYLEKPAAYVKGTRMAFVGIRKESDRKAVIAYMKENTR